MGGAHFVLRSKELLNEAPELRGHWIIGGQLRVLSSVIILDSRRFPSCGLFYTHSARPSGHERFAVNGLHQGDRGQEGIGSGQGEGPAGGSEQVKRQQGQQLQGVHAQKMRHPKVAHGAAPPHNEEVGVVVPSANAVVHAGPHGKAFERKHHKQQDARADGPEVVCGQLRQVLGKEKPAHVGRVQGYGGRRSGHQRIQRGVYGGAYVEVRQFSFAGL